VSRLQVVFDAGPLGGLAVTHELRRGEKRVRTSNCSIGVRFEKDLPTAVGGVDASNTAQAREACVGATVANLAGRPRPIWIGSKFRFRPLRLIYLRTYIGLSSLGRRISSSRDYYARRFPLVSINA
jgi:hypothetical protein